METTTLITCNNSVEANLIKGMLENNGIESFLTNENFTNLMPHLNGVLGAGVQVMVDKKDLRMAQELLEAQRNTDETICPDCGSNNITTGLGTNGFKKRITVLISLFAWIPFGNLKRTHYCKDCKTEF